MWQEAQTAWLPDGRLHLHHGPIDLIIQAWGPERQIALKAAEDVFANILAGLAAELPDLRKPTSAETLFLSPVAGRMALATLPFRADFITPMAAVAGAVADHILSAMREAGRLDKAFVNNGGDIAIHLDDGQSIKLGSPFGVIEISAGMPVRGIATSGWRGRSFSLGIADNVTVLAENAAQADAAATMIANKTDLPDHPSIRRVVGRDLAPDSDLAGFLVTQDVAPLDTRSVQTAIRAGERFAARTLEQCLIHAAAISLQGHFVSVGAFSLLSPRNGLCDAWQGEDCSLPAADCASST